MIDLNSSYVQKAHRLSLYLLDAGVTNVYAGQMFQLNSAGKWTYSDGTKKAYPTLNNRYPGAGVGPQGELQEGRDDVTRAGMIAVLKGNFEIATDQYDSTKTYVTGMPLHPSTAGGAALGKLVPYDAANGAHHAYFICGYVTVPPAVAGTDLLRWEG